MRKQGNKIIKESNGWSLILVTLDYKLIISPFLVPQII